MRSGRCVLSVLGCSLLTLATAAGAQCADGRPRPCRASAPARAAAPPARSERVRSFLVLPFRNLSRGVEQEWLVEGATTILGEALGRWQEISVVADDQLYPALRRHGITPGAVAEPSRVRRVAEETGGWTAVAGQVVATGGRLTLTARAYDVFTNGEIVQARAEGPMTADVRSLFASVAMQLLRGAGLDSATAHPSEVTTSSLDAYRAYLVGVHHINRAQFRQARTALQEAVRIDSTFAQAHFMLVEAALFADPFAAFESSGVLQRSLARSVSLADHFPPAHRELLLAVNATFNGNIAASREVLSRMVTRDSSDLRALAWLGFIEFVDVVLVGPTGRERPRGSINMNLLLARELLRRDPERHDAYLPVVGQYLLASGGFPVIRPGVRREPASLMELFTATPARVFVPLLRDSVVLVPAESLSFVPPDTIAAARRRALDSARAVTNRWLITAPHSAGARYLAAEVAAREGDGASTLRHLDRVDSLGLEFGGADTRLIRLATLAKLGRYDEAKQLASREDTWRAIRTDVGLAAWLESGEARLWGFNLYLMLGDYGRAGEMLDSRTNAIAGLVPVRAMAEAAALQVLAGERFPPVWLVQLPLSFRMDVLDSLSARTPPGTGGPHLESVRPTLARLLSRSATAAGVDPALAARARRSAWFVP